FVPETLIPALDELERGWRDALADDSFRAELHHLLTTDPGRPRPATTPEAVAALRLRLRRLHGRGGHAPPAPQRRADAAARRRGAPGRLRHEDAEGGNERGHPRLDHERRDDALSDRLVRRPGAVSRARGRAAVGDRPRGARAAARRRAAAARG